MNILLGSHGVGKSTLLAQVKELEPRIYVSDGFSRPVRHAAKQFNISKVAEQTLINDLTTWGYINYLAQDRVPILVGRSLIDAIVYTEHFFSEIDTVEMRRLFLDTHKDISNIFYIPIEIKLKADGVRFDRESQLAIDKRMQDFIREYQLRVQVIKGTVKERAEKVIEVISYGDILSSVSHFGSGY